MTKDEINVAQDRVSTDRDSPSEFTSEAAATAIKAGQGKSVDVAARFIAEHGHELRENDYSKDEEKRIIRKVDWRLVPILFVCATLSGLDKTAISAAAIYNLREDLNLTGQQYSWCGSAPFFGGLLFMGPAAYCLQRFPVVDFFALNVFLWGVAEICMAATHNFTTLFVCRFFLGGFEALVIPSVTLLVAMWYRPEEQPKRNAIILNVIAPICNGFIAWTISYYNGPFAPWKIIFLTLGGFTILWSFVVYIFLPNNPIEAKWLTSRQKMIIIQRKASDNTGMENKAFKLSHLREAALDVKTWLIWFAIVALQVPNGGLSTFNTLIIQGLGFDRLETSLLAMPPGAMSTLSGIALSFLAATTRRYRTVMIAAAVLLPLLGAVLCYALPRSNLAGQLVGLYILYTYWAPYVTLVSVYQANIAGHTKKLGLYGWFFIAWTLGNIIGPQTFRESQAPAYIGGITAMMVCYVAAIALVLTYLIVCRVENRKRDRETGGAGLRLGGGADRDGEVDGQAPPASRAQNDWLDLTDKENPTFRYTT